MRRIKDRRLEIKTRSYPDLFVGSCTPFYFCPRSIMLYMIEKGNRDLEYKGGQKRIVHLVADLYKVVEWANANNRRWVFTKSNAGSRFFEDYADLGKLDQIDWEAVNARLWPDKKDGKQAEFLIETALPWFLIEEIGVYSREEYNDVHAILEKKETHPSLNIRSDWYY